MNLEKRVQKIEEQLKPLIEAHRPVVKIHFKEDRNVKLKELKVQYGEDYDPKFEVTFEGVSRQELHDFVLGRNDPNAIKTDIEDFSPQELLDYVMGRGTRKPKVLA